MTVAPDSVPDSGHVRRRAVGRRRRRGEPVLRSRLARHPWLVTTYASLVVLTVLGAFVPNRDRVPRAVAALALGVVVALVSALGVWRAGVAAALLAATGFAYYLAQPYDAFAFTRTEDVVLSGLPLLITLVTLAIRAWRDRRDGATDRRAAERAEIGRRAPRQ